MIDPEENEPNEPIELPVLTPEDQAFMDGMDGTFDDPEFVEKFIERMDDDQE